MSRTQTAYASAYQRDRVHVSQVLRGESRQLVANFNALMAKPDTITTVTWRAESGQPLTMSAATISGHTASVRVVANSGGVAIMKCVVTTSARDTLTQLFRIESGGSPYFAGEVFPTASGPLQLVMP